MRKRRTRVIDFGQQRPARAQRLGAQDGIGLNDQHTRSRPAEVISVSLSHGFGQ
jgi:hypothetical protein